MNEGQGLCSSGLKPSFWIWDTLVAAENPLGDVEKRDGILHHHCPVGRFCPRETLCFLLQV